MLRKTNARALSAMLDMDADLGQVLLEFDEAMLYFECAMNVIRTRLEIIDKETRTISSHSPIHSITTRLKSLSSIADKLRNRNLPFSVASMVENLHDIAGVRVVCDYIPDIYTVMKALLAPGDLKLVEIKDYIKSPKINGYRSLHLIVDVPVNLCSGVHYARCEIQLRTMAMELWADLEHSLRYKRGIVSNQVDYDLKRCARSLAETDDMMEAIALSLGVFAKEDS